MQSNFYPLRQNLSSYRERIFVTALPEQFLAKQIQDAICFFLTF